MADWIHWTGGDCPCTGQRVEVKTRGGGGAIVDADGLSWAHQCKPWDIVAYRDPRINAAPLAPSKIEPLIEEAFLAAYLGAFPDAWAKDEHSTTRIIGEAIAKGIAAAIKVWERR